MRATSCLAAVALAAVATAGPIGHSPGGPSRGPPGEHGRPGRPGHPGPGSGPGPSPDEPEEICKPGADDGVFDYDALSLRTVGARNTLVRNAKARRRRPALTQIGLASVAFA
jgi:hypothetical protein